MGLIMLPSDVRDFANPELADLIHKTQKSSVYSPEDRVKVLKLCLGCCRIRVRVAPHHVRDVLCRPEFS